MHTVFGLLGLVVYIACAIGLAAGLTWFVIRFFPTPGSGKNKPAQ
jgi:hypothetical protein